MLQILQQKNVNKLASKKYNICVGEYTYSPHKVLEYNIKCNYSSDRFFSL